MAAFSNYDSSQPDLRDEITAAKTNPLEPGRQYRTFAIGGVAMKDPEWEMEPLAPLLDTMYAENDFGTTYDYMPDKLSHELYGTHELWLILMRINGAKHRGEFVGPVLRYIRPAYAADLLQMVRFGVTQAAVADASGIQVVDDLTVRTVYST
jgi:hypothetical protein